MIRDNVSFSFFFYQEEKTYLITCISEILPLFLLKKEKDKANFRENDISSSFSRSLFNKMRTNQKQEKQKKKKKVVCFFFFY